MRILELEASEILTALTTDAQLTFTDEDRLQGVSPETIVLGVEELSLTYHGSADAHGSSHVRYIAGRRHIRIADVIWELAMAMIAIAPTAVSPTGVTQLVAGATAAKALISLKQKITNLTDQQLEICRAVAAVVRRKMSADRILQIKEADIKEIREELHSRGQDVADLGPMLADLVPRVLKSAFHGGRGPFYAVVP